MKQNKWSGASVVIALVLLFLGLVGTGALAESDRLKPVTPGYKLIFPQDYGAHQDFRIEWWYITGWLETEDKKPLGFQVTFFRYATGHNQDNPSQFAAKYLIIAHLALSDPAAGKLMHEEKSLREGFNLAYAKEGNTDVRLDDWTLVREENGRYQVEMQGSDFGLSLALTPAQMAMLQDQNGFSRKGPKPEQASYYYSEPHLSVTGTVFRDNKPVTVSGRAWLDHEWSTAYLDPEADGWDWTGANLDDGSALMAFQIRRKGGGKVWAYAALRDPSGNMRLFEPEQVEFTPVRTWQSPHTEAAYPVAMHIRTGEIEWRLTPLLDDQELDSRQSTGSVYWEGAVTLTKDNQPAGKGYLELTGYVKPLAL
ncbi:lipocalin-like domain-containing protein [Nitrosomonas oligotropha]|uniref:lipocalin-like domain-containing protein n=1 Tax=Nitrosomonas oligotropha TaxID=42354 RepID=UPI00136D0532|nr:carotenoid 1,2-hydratase [Nitrosomonas oligotropha]MXS83028.1 carotenoid 1,2-hydratase [Nitrosomonas oligotropha]